MAETLSNPRPIIKAASACIWRNGKVLLVRRAKTLGKGLWSLPGGKVERGETLEQAAIREVLEETGLSFQPTHLVGEYLIELPEFTYVIACFTGTCGQEVAIAASDADAVVWLQPKDINTLPLAPNTADAIAKAADLNLY